MFGDATLQLLAILLLPIAGGLICILLVMRQDAIRAGRYKRITPQCAVNCNSTLGVLSIKDAYDPERDILWENQILALQRISSHAALPELLALWERYVHLYPELYEQTTFWEWLAFLQNCTLVQSSGNEVRLTPNGRQFLKYLISNANAGHHRSRSQG